MTLLLSHRENWYTTCFLVLYLHNSHRSLLISKKGDALVLSLCLWSLFLHLQPPRAVMWVQRYKRFSFLQAIRKILFLRPARPDLCRSTSGAYPSRLCECKGTTFLIPRKPCPTFSLKINAPDSCITLIYNVKNLEKKSSQSLPRIRIQRTRLGSGPLCNTDTAPLSHYIK